MTGLEPAAGAVLLVLGVTAIPGVVVRRSRAWAAVASGGCLVFVGGANSVAASASDRLLAVALVPLAIWLLALVTAGPRPLLAPALVGALLAGPVHLLADDPFLDPGCRSDCARNPFALLPSPQLATTSLVLGFLLLVAALAAQVVAGRGARVPLTLVTSVGAALALGAAPSWSAVAAAAASWVLGVELVSASTRRGRLHAAVERLAVVRDPQDLLRAQWGDARVAVVYRVDGAAGWCGADGRPVSTPGPDVAVVDVSGPHGVIAQIRLPRETAERHAWSRAWRGPVRLALDNARLGAQAAARAREITASSRRLLQATADERRRLERDLHDGAQQHVLTLGLLVSAGEQAADTDGRRHDAERARQVIGCVLDELRDIAHGVHAARLDNGGLEPALTALAYRSPVPLGVLAVPDRRPDALRETTAYAVVEEVVAGATGPVDVSITFDDDDLRLVIDVETAADGRAAAVLAPHTGDLFRALGGTLVVSDRRGMRRLSGVLPSPPQDSRTAT